MFDRMKLKMNTEEFEAFFSSVDIDGSGEISYAEFKLEFDKMTSTPIENLLALHDNKSKMKTQKLTGATFTSAPPSGGSSYLGTEEVK